MAIFLVGRWQSNHEDWRRRTKSSTQHSVRTSKAMPHATAATATAAMLLLVFARPPLIVGCAKIPLTVVGVTLLLTHAVVFAAPPSTVILAMLPLVHVVVFAAASS